MANSSRLKADTPPGCNCSFDVWIVCGDDQQTADNIFHNNGVLSLQFGCGEMVLVDIRICGSIERSELSLLS